MKPYIFIVCVFFAGSLFYSCSHPKPQQFNIIPVPNAVQGSAKNIKIDANSRILYEDPNPELRLVAEFLASALNEKCDFFIAVEPYSTSKPLANDIILLLNLADSTYGNEGYAFSHHERKAIKIQANQSQGVFYGVQTLLQLIPVSKEKVEKLIVPTLRIDDAPRFKYRGMHLDVARHFFSIDFIKQYIDLLAYYKFNRFHWHLTEDQGWRIEINQYPQLIQVGSKRKHTIIGHQGSSNKQFDGIEYSGFYSQNEIREIVDYAARRYITIVPEIEMPGHALAALASYPQLGCTSGPYEVAGEWGVFNDVFCTRDEVFTFLENVLSEVIDLFPGEYIHIGGDEVPKTRWKSCPDCQKRIKMEGLKDEYELQSYFIRRIEKFVASKGKKIIGWDEILEGGLAPNATVMSWRGTEGGIHASKLGHDVIMTHGSHCYFDHYQSRLKTEPLAIGGLTKVSKVYAFEPVPNVLTENEAKHILGAQANVWTEYIKNPSHITYMILPRMAALAEVVWSSKENRNWDSFYHRLPAHFEYYKSRDLNFSDAVYSLDYKIETDKLGDNVVHFESEIPGAEIRYCRNSNWSIETASAITDQVYIAKDEVISASIVVNGKQFGRIVEVRL